MKINRLVVVGFGLIGGSFAAAIRKSGCCREIIAVVPDQAVLNEAVQYGIADRGCLSLGQLSVDLGAGDVIFIAVPTLAVESVLCEIKETVSPDVVITDAASVKGSVAYAAERVWGVVPSNFVLGHPIAGSEKSGVSAADPELYSNHRVILTPLEDTDMEALSLIEFLWQATGAEVLHMPVAEHDEVLAATSHLPHVIAYSLVDTLAHDAENENIFRYAAGGFRDFTRIASSNPQMWHDIVLANRDAVLKSLDLFGENLAALRQAIDAGDGEQLLAVFSRAKLARDHFTQLLQEKQAANSSAAE